ncbi:hypothetical protein ABII15_38415 (plasmid) [Streptomyces sp. HUAS MG91]|uniref:HIRAN domain-containing protein n=1 Tax=Streptomyces tabacisoli TaxID=3156398 RepID=A0AAU8J7F7_9ACTN
MSKKDVWVRIGSRTFAAKTIKGMDDSEPRYLQVRVTGEREPLKVRGRIPYRAEGLTDEERRRYSDSVLPVVVAQGLLDAIAACTADGGHWLLSFEDNSACTEASWVRSELGKSGLPPQRRAYAGPSVTANTTASDSVPGGADGSETMPAGDRALLALGYGRDSHRRRSLDERERQRMLAQVPAHWRVPGRSSAAPGMAGSGSDVEYEEDVAASDEQRCGARHGGLGRICELRENHVGLHRGHSPAGVFACWEGDADVYDD